MSAPENHSRPHTTKSLFPWLPALLAAALLLPPIPFDLPPAKTPDPAGTHGAIAIADDTAPAEPWHGEWTGRLPSGPTPDR